MSHVPQHIDDAAFEAQMAAADKIATALGIERASPADVAIALAHAYGSAVGLYAMTGAASDQLEALGRVALRATQGMVSRIQTSDCAGRA